MAKPKKTTGSGTKALISADGNTYVEFASVSKISPPSMSRGTTDVTDMNSYFDNDQFKEFLGGFIEGDEMSIDGYFVIGDEGREALEDAFYSGDECYVKIQLPPTIGKSMIVRGIVTKYQPIGEITPDNGIAFSTSIKPNGKAQLIDTTAEATLSQS